MSPHDQDLIRFLTECAVEASQEKRAEEAEELLALRGAVINRLFQRSQLQLPLELQQAA